MFLFRILPVAVLLAIGSKAKEIKVYTPESRLLHKALTV